MDASEKTLMTQQGRCWGCRGSGHRGEDSCCPLHAVREKRLHSFLPDEDRRNSLTPDQGHDQERSKERFKVIPGSLTLSLSSLDMEERLKKGKHMRFSVRVNNHRTMALLDNGSEGDLIDHSHVRRLNILTFRLTQPLPLYLGNGKLYRELTEAALLELDIGDHHEQLVCYVTDMPRYQLVLGDTWLREHNPAINWKQRAITFNSSDCFEKGCLRGGKPYTKYTTGRTKHAPSSTLPDRPPVDIAMVSAYAFYRLAKKHTHEGFVMLPRDHEKYFCASTTNAITVDDYDHFLKDKKKYSLEDLKTRVPKEYHSEIDAGLGVVRVVQSQMLPLHYTSLVAKFFTPHHITPNYRVDTTLH